MCIDEQIIIQVENTSSLPDQRWRHFLDDSTKKVQVRTRTQISSIHQCLWLTPNRTLVFLHLIWCLNSRRRVKWTKIKATLKLLSLSQPDTRFSLKNINTVNVLTVTVQEGFHVSNHRQQFCLVVTHVPFYVSTCKKIWNINKSLHFQIQETTLSSDTMEVNEGFRGRHRSCTSNRQFASVKTKKSSCFDVHCKKRTDCENSKNSKTLISIVTEHL